MPESDDTDWDPSEHDGEGEPFELRLRRALPQRYAGPGRPPGRRNIASDIDLEDMCWRLWRDHSFNFEHGLCTKYSAIKQVSEAVVAEKFGVDSTEAVRPKANDGDKRYIKSNIDRHKQALWRAICDLPISPLHECYYFWIQENLTCAVSIFDIADYI